MVSVFLVYNKVSVIMASGRELCYVLLLGILASYSVPFFALARPNIVTCAILRSSPLSPLHSLDNRYLSGNPKQSALDLANMLMMMRPPPSDLKLPGETLIFK